jgi:hypothetical protein
MRLLHVSAPTCHPQRASMSLWVPWKLRQLCRASGNVNLCDLCAGLWSCFVLCFPSAAMHGTNVKETKMFKEFHLLCWIGAVHEDCGLLWCNYVLSFLRPWRWQQRVSLKRRYWSIILQDVTSQKTVIVIVKVVENRKCHCVDLACWWRGTWNHVLRVTYCWLLDCWAVG